MFVRVMRVLARSTFLFYFSVGKRIRLRIATATWVCAAAPRSVVGCQSRCSGLAHLSPSGEAHRTRFAYDAFNEAGKAIAFMV